MCVGADRGGRAPPPNGEACSCRTSTMDEEVTGARSAVLSGLGKNASHVRRNYTLGVVAGLFASVSRDFIHPELILVGLVYALTKSPLLAGLIPVINKGGVLAPQLIVGTLTEHAPRRRPYFIMAAIVRSVALGGVVVGMWLLTQGVTSATLAVFFGAYLVFCASSGACGVVFADMVGRLIPSDRVGGFLGARGLLGGGVSVLTGMLIIQPVLAGVKLPTNYLVLAVIGMVLAVTDMTIWCNCKEEPGPRAERQGQLMESLRRGAQWLRSDHNYRCYLGSRVAFRLNYLGLAFFIPYGTEELGSGSDAGVAVLGGLMVATLRVSGVLGAAVLPKVGDLWGSRTALIGSALLLLVAPALALLAPALPGLYQLGLPGMERPIDLPMTVYLLALAAMGAGMSGTVLAGQRFLITNAPPDRRPSYVAFLGTITSPLTLLPLAGAWLAGVAGMKAVFVVVLCGGLLSLASAGLMQADRQPGAGYA